MPRSRWKTPWRKETAVEPAADSERAPRTSCPYDGGPLSATGFCATAGGYPLGTERSDFCPHCRHRLEWDGGCQSCFGSSSGRRTDRTFPGSRYDRFDDEGRPLGDGQHWILTDPTLNRPAVDLEEARTALHALLRVIGGPLPTTRSSRG